MPSFTLRTSTGGSTLRGGDVLRSGSVAEPPPPPPEPEPVTAEGFVARHYAFARLYTVGAGMPIEVEAWDPQFNPPRLIAVLEGARSPSWMDVLNDPGSFTFRIPLADPKAGERIIAPGIIVKFKLHGGYRFAGSIDQLTKVVSSVSGQAGEWLTVSGPGSEAYLSRALLDAPDRDETGAFIAVLLRAWIAEAATSARNVLPLMTVDWSDTLDSAGLAWDDDADWAFPWGTTSLMDVLRTVIGMGIDVRMTPSLVLQAYESGLGSHLESSVVFRHGWHLRSDVERTRNEGTWQNVMLVRGKDGAKATVYGDHSDPRRGRREGTVEFGATNSPTALVRAGEAAIAASVAQASAVRLPLHHGMRDGHFEPYLDYAKGDHVGLRIPDLPASTRIAAITISGTDGGGFTVDVDGGAVRLDNMVRLKRLIESSDLLRVAGL